MNGLLDLIVPRTCVVCGRILSLREKHICIYCLGDLPRTYYSRMSRNPMADRFNGMIQRGLDAGIPRTPYAHATALFFYRSGYKDIPRSLKYHGNVRSGRYFAGLLADEIAASDLFSDVDTVIPVPLHWTRRWVRGYNQAEIIGKEVADRLGVSLRTDVLVRSRRTRTQTRLSVEAKATNVAGAFNVRKGVDLSGCRHILIVDDVFTTGATVCSCYFSIRAVTNPDQRISVATLACVGM